MSSAAPSDQNTEPLSEFRTPSSVGEGGVLCLRALISTKEANILTSGAREGTLKFEDDTGVDISEASSGTEKRVLTATGAVEGVANVFFLVASHLVSPEARSETSSPAITTVRLLISYWHVSSIIGNYGKKIRANEEASAARLFVYKQIFPQSTERFVDLQGTAEAIGQAVGQIGKSLLAATDRQGGGDDDDDETVVFQPGPGARIDDDNAQPPTEPKSTTPDLESNPSAGRKAENGQQPSNTSVATPKKEGPSSSPQPLSSEKTQTSAPPVLETRKMSIPEDMVGYVLGRNRSNLAWIRRTARAKINLASQPTQKKGDDAERVLKIVGTALAVETAISLIEKRVERARRLRAGGWTGSRQGSQAREDEDEEQG